MMRVQPPKPPMPVEAEEDEEEPLSAPPQETRLARRVGNTENIMVYLSCIGIAVLSCL